MKTLILYGTKRGATAEIARRLSTALGGADVRNLKEGIPSLEGYDCVVLGSPLMAGAVRGEVKAFTAKQAAELGTRRLGIFLSGLDDRDPGEYLRNNFPGELVEHARAKALLGGVYDPKKCGPLTRIMMKMAVKVEQYTNTIDDERIRAFARDLLA